MDTDAFLNTLADNISTILGDNLVGIYLHGSLAMGCFNPQRSDIDLLVVIEQELTKDKGKAMAKRLLQAHEELQSGLGVELSIILKSTLEPFAHPSPFEWHYSDFHRARYAEDDAYRCGGGSDPDLTAHLTVIYYRGRTIAGKPIRDVIPLVPPSNYVNASLNDIEGADTKIVEEPVYYTLNLCRVLLYLKEERVASKKEGGEWALQALPSIFNQVVSECLRTYTGLSDTMNLKETQLIQFAEYMLGEIHSQNPY